MEQKLFYIYVENIDTSEIEFPKDLQDLLNSGWRIKQISSVPVGVAAQDSSVILLLEKETN